MELHPSGHDIKGEEGRKEELKELWREGEVSFAARSEATFPIFLQWLLQCRPLRPHRLEDKYSPHVIGIAEMRQSRIRARSPFLSGSIVKSSICYSTRAKIVFRIVVRFCCNQCT